MGDFRLLKRDGKKERRLYHLPRHARIRDGSVQPTEKEEAKADEKVEDQGEESVKTANGSRP